VEVEHLRVDFRSDCCAFTVGVKAACREWKEYPADKTWDSFSGMEVKLLVVTLAPGVAAKAASL